MGSAAELGSSAGYTGPNSFPFPFTVGYVNWLFDLSKRHYLPNIVKLNIHHATVD